MMFLLNDAVLTLDSARPPLDPIRFRALSLDFILKLGAEAFADELKAYKGGKGTVQFPYAQPLPADLVRRIVRYRVGQVQAGGK